MQYLTPVERAVATYCPHWQIVPADSPGIVCINPETLNGSTPADFSFQYIDISSVNKGTIDWASVQTIRFADAPSRARRVVRPGDVLICTVRPLLGSHTAATWNQQDGYVCSTGFAVIRPQGTMLPGFLKHLPFAEQVTRQLVAWQCGTNYPAVNENDIHRLRLPLPSPEEQRTITRILDAVDHLLDKTQDAAYRARHAKRALLQQLFTFGLRRESQKKTAIGWIPQSWTIAEVKSVVTEFQYGMSVSMQTSGTLPILRMGNIQAGDVILSDLKYVRLPERFTAPYLLRRGDVLFNRTNSQELVGKIGIYRSDEPCVFASYLIRLKHDPDQVDNYYLGQLLDSHDAQCRIKRYATPGVQQVNINAKNLGKVLIPLPPGEAGLEEQREIATILEQADATIRAYGPKLRALQELKRALMHDLLTGSVRLNTKQLQAVGAV